MKLTKNGLAFIALAFGLAWGLCAIAWLAGVRSGGTSYLVLAILMMFTPLAAALLTGRGAAGGAGARESLAIRFRMGWRGFILSWLLFPAAAIAALGLALLLPGVSFDPTMSQLIERLTAGLPSGQVEEARRAAAALPVPPLLIILLQGLAAGLTVNAVAGFGEEAGWRGRLVGELRGSGFWGASLFTGAVWGLWHAPLILQGHNYPEHPVAGLFMMVAWCVLLSPLFLYVRLKTRSSVAAAIAHGSLNGTAGLAVMPLRGGSDLSVGLTGAAGLAVLALVVLAVWLVDRRSARPVMASRLGDPGLGDQGPAA